MTSRKNREEQEYSKSKCLALALILSLHAYHLGKYEKKSTRYFWSWIAGTGV